MINWDFIRSKEGFSLKGYVPDAASSKSGVTVATGVDIGHMTSQTYLALRFDVQNLLTPYLGLVGIKAQQKLNERPLELTQEQADYLDSGTQTHMTDELTETYNQFSKVSFSSIPDEAQTIICDVFYQYGPLNKKAPKFWGRVIVQDWKGAQEELRNFGDAYPTRRNAEADYLTPIIPS